MTIDEVKAIQREREMGDVHVVELREDGFSMAHTDKEREDAHRHGVPLTDCQLHCWLVQTDAMPVEEPGLYAVTIPEVDGYSTSFRSTPFEFTRMET